MLLKVSLSVKHDGCNSVLHVYYIATISVNIERRNTETFNLTKIRDNFSQIFNSQPSYTKPWHTELAGPPWNAATNIQHAIKKDTIGNFCRLLDLLTGKHAWFHLALCDGGNNSVD